MNETEVKQRGGQLGNTEIPSTAQTIASELPANLADLSQFPAIRDDIHRNFWNI